MLSLLGVMLMSLVAAAQTTPPVVSWDCHSLMFDGRRVMPVMGEIHYSRLPESEWANEVRKMKEGGVTIIANYVFWNHVEEQQGIFDWSGQRNLRHFIEICKDEGMPVCLRIGPYCHGEARCGGIPDWVVKSGCKLRSEDPQFAKTRSSSLTWKHSTVRSLRRCKACNGRTAALCWHVSSTMNTAATALI